MNKGFIKAYVDMFLCCYNNNGKLKSFFIFMNPVIIWIMFIYFINIKRRYDYEY